MGEHSCRGQDRPHLASPTLNTDSRDFTPFLFNCPLLTICSSNLYTKRYLNKYFIKKNTPLYINYICNMFSYFICQSKSIAGECLLKKDVAVSMPFFSKRVANEFDANSLLSATLYIKQCIINLCGEFALNFMRQNGYTLSRFIEGESSLLWKTKINLILKFRVRQFLENCYFRLLFQRCIFFFFNLTFGKKSFILLKCNTAA